jgi:hypothetical protein
LQAFKNIISQGLEYIIDRKLELKGAGIAFPGPFDFEKATPLMKHKFQTIYGLDLRNYFYDATGIHAIFLSNLFTMPMPYLWVKFGKAMLRDLKMRPW